jgi:hypothetical protein
MRLARLNAAFWFGVIFLTYCLIGAIKDFRMSYWLTADGKPSTALLTEEHGRVVTYRYSVDDVEYTGSSRKNWENERYRNVHTGQESIVYFSASHPGISSLETPCFPPRRTLLHLLLLLFLAGWVLLFLERSRGSTVATAARISTPSKLKLRWYQHLWLALPFMLLLFGGAMGGACGGAAWTINGWVFRKTEHPALRYLWTGLISLGAVAAFLAFIFLALGYRRG